MNITSLVIMAAGMGSRYGGIKQLDTFGPNGEIIMDYSIYDALSVGFDKIIIIIRREIFDDFMAVIGNRLKKLNVPIHYVFQDLENLPEGFRVPDGRTKPWGTGQAVLSIKEYIDEPFLVVNADDFYGRDPFLKLQSFLANSRLNKKKSQFCLAGYVLKNTLSNSGSVSRGVLSCTDDYKLLSINETFSIKKEGDIITGIDSSGNQVILPENTLVSMNMMGFTPSIFNFLESKFRDFLSELNEKDPLKSEFLIPIALNELLHDNLVDIQLIKTSASWFGITYKNDRKYVENSLIDLRERGVYPDKLWQI